MAAQGLGEMEKKSKFIEAEKGRKLWRTTIVNALKAHRKKKRGIKQIF